MVERDTILKETVWYVGIANFKGYYEYAYDWLVSNDFVVIEDRYKETQKGDSREVEISWRAYRKVSDYFRIFLDLKWKVLDMVDVEVEIDGKKKKMQKMAECSLKIKGVLEKDYTSKWGPNNMYRMLKDLYHKYIIPQRTEKFEIDTMEIVQQFKEEMKAYLELIGKHAV